MTDSHSSVASGSHPFSPESSPDEMETGAVDRSPCACVPAPRPIQEAVADLHAATLAVILHTESLELKTSCASYWTRVLARHYRDDAIVERLRMHLRAVQRRAWQQAEALGGGLIARGLAELVQGTRDDGPIELER